jgi:hypothetical protein
MELKIRIREKKIQDGEEKKRMKSSNKKWRKVEWGWKKDY